jgi:hypothetical protein
MKLDPRLRRGLVFGGLAATLGAMWLTDPGPEITKANAAQDRGRRTAAVAIGDAPLVSAPRKEVAEGSAASQPVAEAVPRLAERTLDPALIRRGGSGRSGDAFAPRTWEPPASRAAATREAAAALPAPPPPPQAPPLPFRYVGMLGLTDEAPIVFLEKQDTGYAVKAGDVIDGIYRIDEAAEGRVVFTYLPLDQRQTLVAKTE